MEETISKLRKHFPTFPNHFLRRIEKERAERMRLLMTKKILVDVRWLIEAKVRMSGEFTELPVSRMPGFGRSTYAKKRRARQLGDVCHRCARTTCNTHCKSLGMVSDNREDKINFIRDELSKESLDDILRTLETHPSGYVHRAILNLHAQFQWEIQQFSTRKLTLNDPVCRFIKKLDERQNPSSSRC